mgnify:FL=1
MFISPAFRPPLAADAVPDHAALVLRFFTGKSMDLHYILLDVALNRQPICITRHQPVPSLAVFKTAFEIRLYDNKDRIAWTKTDVNGLVECKLEFLVDRSIDVHFMATMSGLRLCRDSDEPHSFKKRSIHKGKFVVLPCKHDDKFLAQDLIEMLTTANGRIARANELDSFLTQTVPSQF